MATRRRSRPPTPRSTRGLDAVVGDRRRPHPARLSRGVIAATLRTNAFAPAAAGGAGVQARQRTWSPACPRRCRGARSGSIRPRVEGIHLRAGPVARGGLRWSDRRDDFRTEILGLMKAQRVKNAVIVPTGAKGGFYPKQLPARVDRDAWLAEGTESYRIFIRSLLSITDNIVEGKVVHPAGRRDPRRRGPLFRRRRRQGHRDLLRRRQRDRDRARLLARRRLRLGRQSVGYDHKAMGITAKGAWISVQRHFAEMGVDVQTAADPRRRLRRHVGRRVRQRHAAVEGDQAGRGVRPSPHLPRSRSRSGAELGRARAHVRAAALELGGLRRHADLEGRRRLRAHRQDRSRSSPQVRRCSASRPSEIEPDRADLRDPQGAGRPALVRRHRHLCEGRGREQRRGRRSRQRPPARQCRGVCAPRRSAKAPISASRRPRASPSPARGGRINTDFIDNSAGVDCSDNEVNIKIALNREMIEGRLAYRGPQRAAREHDRRCRASGARGQPPADAGAVDRRE